MTTPGGEDLPNSERISLNAQVADLKRTVAELKEQQQQNLLYFEGEFREVNGHMAGIDAGVEALAAEFAKTPSTVFHWPELEESDPERATEKRTAILLWVDEVLRGFPDAHRQLAKSPCWEGHPDARAYVTALWGTWENAIHGKDDWWQVAQWYRDYLPAFGTMLQGALKTHHEACGQIRRVA